MYKEALKNVKHSTGVKMVDFQSYFSMLGFYATA